SHVREERPLARAAAHALHRARGAEVIKTLMLVWEIADAGVVALVPALLHGVETGDVEAVVGADGALHAQNVVERVVEALVFLDERVGAAAEPRLRLAA